MREHASKRSRRQTPEPHDATPVAARSPQTEQQGSDPGTGHDFSQITVMPDQAFDTATSGQARSIPYREEMEAAFGYDFGNVQAFLGDTPAASGLDQLNAHAAAHGQQIAFESPQPSRQLVAHELTHIVQQHNSAANQTTGHQHRTAETEAHHVGSRVASGQQAGPIGAAGGGIQLNAKSDTPGPKSVGTLPTQIGTSAGELQRIRGFEDFIGGPPPGMAQQKQNFSTLQSAVDNFHARVAKFAQQAEANRAMTTYLNKRPEILDALYKNPGFGAGITLNFLAKIPPQNPAVPFSPVATFQGITYNLMWDTGNINVDNVLLQSGKAQTIDVAPDTRPGVAPEQVSPEGYRFQSVTLWEPAVRSQLGTAAKPGTALEVNSGEEFWRIARAEGLGAIRVHHALANAILESMASEKVQLGATTITISPALKQPLLRYYATLAEGSVNKNLEAYRANVDALQQRLHRVCAKGVSWWERFGGKTPPDPHMLDGSHFQVWAAGDAMKNQRYVDAWKALEFGWQRNEDAEKAIAQYE